MIKACLFDLDGTLLDSMNFWENVAQNYLLSIGIKTKEDLCEKFRTYTVLQAARYFIENYDLLLSEAQIVQGINDFIKDYYETRVCLKSGVTDFLQKLKAENIRMCIVTSTQKELAKSALERCGVISFFEDIFSCANSSEGKTSPEIFETACKALLSSPCEAIVFEDAFFALETAKNAGFITAGVYEKCEKQHKKIKEISHFFIQNFENVDFDFFLKKANDLSFNFLPVEKQ